MILVHDDDLERIDGIGGGIVSAHVIKSYINIHILVVTPNPSTRRGDGSPPEVPHRDT
jgi:hypothetical protein